MALQRRILRRHSFLDVAFDRFHHDDGVVDHQADGQHQAEQRQRVDGEAEHRKDDERADQRTGTASSGMSVARQPCRNMNTTSTTRPSASSSV